MLEMISRRKDSELVEPPVCSYVDLIKSHVRESGYVIQTDMIPAEILSVAIRCRSQGFLKNVASGWFGQIMIQFIHKKNTEDFIAD